MRLPLLPVLALLAGCPEPVPDQGTTPDGSAKPAPAAMNKPPADGQGGGEMQQQATGVGTLAAVPESELVPRFTQEQLADGAEITGTLVCADCTSGLLIRVLPPPPDPGAVSQGDPEELQLVTFAAYPGAGPYSLRVPKGETVVLQVVDDANGDGQPSAGERMGIRMSGPLLVDQDKVEGVNLAVGEFPQMPARDVEGQALEGSPVGPPSPSGVPVDPTPPEGAGD